MADQYSGYNFALCDVLSVDDESEGGRIKVRIPGTDESTTEIKDLPFCFPLLPKLLVLKPKVNEKVMVFFQKPNSKETLRTYIGPIITQDYYLNFAPGSIGKPPRTTIDAISLSKNDMGPGEAPSRNSQNDGYFPVKDENAIVLRGRSNSDIILKENETQIRCGFLLNPKDKDEKKKLNYNSVDLGYIQLKYKPSKDEKGENYKSNINIVADRINILSHDSSTYFPLGTKHDLISDETMDEILNKAHPLPYGDELVAFLKDFVRVFKEHSHPFHQEPPCLTSANDRCISIDLNNLLSKSIRIN